MITITKLAKFYVSLKCIERMKPSLIGLKITIPEEVYKLIESCWLLFYGAQKIPAKSIDRLVGKMIVDFDDAGYLESVKNFYLFALSSFLTALINDDESAFEEVRELTLEFFRYQVEMKDLLESNVGAVVCTPEEDERIERDPLIQNEIRSQVEDMQFAENVQNWLTFVR